MKKTTFAALFTIGFVIQLGVGIVSPLMPFYSESMNASGLWLGIMFASYALARVIFATPLGRLSDRVGHRRVMAAGLLAYAMISLLYIPAGSIYVLTFIRFMHGLASAAVLPIVQAYAGELTPKGKESTYINLVFMSMFIGIGAGPLLSGVLTEHFSMNAAFFTMGGLNILAMIMLFFFIPPVEQISKSGDTKGITPLKIIARDNRIVGLFIFLATRSFWRQGIIAFLSILTFQSLGLSAASIGLVISVYLFTGGLVQGFVGPLADRSNKVALVIIFGIIGPALIYLLPFASTERTLLAILVPVALIGAIARGSALGINVELGKKHRAMGTVMGINAMSQSLGMVIGPILFGLTMDYFGVNSVFILGASVGVIGGGVTAYYLLRKQPPLY